MADELGILKLAPTLSGKERAILILRDLHEAKCGNKRGFLSEAERAALVRFNNADEQYKFNKTVNLYEASCSAMIRISESRLLFQSLYGHLGKAHLLLAQSPGLRMLKNVFANAVMERIKTEEEYASCDTADYWLVVKGGVEDEWMKISNGDLALRKRLEVLLGFVDHLQVVEPKGNDYLFTDEVSFSESIGYVKDLAEELHQCACELVTMRGIIDRIGAELGFCPINSEDYNGLVAFEVFVKTRIECHNEIVREAIRDDSAEAFLKFTKQEPKKCYKKLKDMQEYLIKEPIINEEEYTKWDKRLFRKH